MKGYVYKIVNLSNWKVYIGQTVQTPEKRWADHISDANRQKGNCIKLRRALHKYGSEMFSFEVIAEVDRNSEKEVFDILNELETYYIKYYDSIRWGYNITEGGNGHSTRKYLYLETDDEGNLVEVWKATENLNAINACQNEQVKKYTKVYNNWERQVSEDLEIFELFAGSMQRLV